MTATRIAKRDGADEALLVEPDGAVMEAPTSTIFWVDGEGALHTPSLGAGILASITRERIMRVAPVEESDDYQLRDVLDAAEVFLASSLREVQGVSSLDGLTFTCPGPVTQRVAGSARRADRSRALRRPEPRGRMNFDLSDEQRLIRETARDFADREIVPRARDNDRNERFDLELVKKLGDMGYLGAPVAEEYGGRGLDYLSYGLVVEEIGRGDSSAAHRRVGPDLARRGLDRAVGHRGAEARRSCRSSARANGWAASASPSPVQGPTPPRSRRARRARTAAGRSPARRCSSRSATTPSVAMIFAQTDPEKKHRGHGLLPRPDRPPGLSAHRRSTASSACAPRIRPSWRSTRSR